MEYPRSTRDCHPNEYEGYMMDKGKTATYTDSFEGYINN